MQKEREDNWKLLRQKVEKMSISSKEAEYTPQESKNEVFQKMCDDEIECITNELGSVNIIDEDPVNHQKEEKDLHSDLQQIDGPPAQYQTFRRKSIIPVDETVCNLLIL